MDSGLLVAGCADGGFRCVPLEKGIFFDSAPRLWKSLCGSISVGLSALSISKACGNRRTCAAGADDGSVVLFELIEL